MNTGSSVSRKNSFLDLQHQTTGAMAFFLLQTKVKKRQTYSPNTYQGKICIRKYLSKIYALNFG